MEAPEKALKFGEQAKISASTKPNSLIALLAVDQSVTFMGTDNVISQALLDLNLSPSIKEYSYKIDKKNEVFGKINAFRLSLATGLKQMCTPSQDQLFDIIGAHNWRSGSDWGIDQPTLAIGDDIEVRHNFPEVWFQEVKETSSGSYVLTKNLPDTITTWIVSGFSINPQYGLAVANQKEVKVFQDFFIRIEKPYSVKLEEIVNIKVIVHNYLDSQASTQVTLNNKEGQFNFIEGNRKIAKTSSTLTTNGETSQVTFTIVPKNTGKINLDITAKSKNLNDKILDSFLVDVVGVNKQQTRSVIVNLNQNHTYIEDLNLDVNNPLPKTVSISAVVSKDLLGPAPNNIDKLM